MKNKQLSSIKAIFFISSVVLLTLFISARSARTLPQTPTGQIDPKWTYTLPGKSCPWSSTDKNCYYSSPVLADINDDGVADIVVATNNGHILAFSNVTGTTGTLLWNRDISPNFGMAANSEEIVSSPAVADIDGDGLPEIVVGVGTIYPSVCTQGGVIVLEHNGTVKSGWPFITDDYTVDPAGCADSVVATPAIGDLDRDGRVEIIFGSFDSRIYALRSDGTLFPGFPIASALYERLGWPILEDRLADTIWSSPALADVNGDGYLEIITGTDEGNFDDSHGGDSGGWNCPYTLPPDGAPGYCGGALYVIDRFGHNLPGFPKYLLEVITSSPALYDVTGDGIPEIFVGTGTYYYNNSPDQPTDGFRVYAWDGEGNEVSGWEGGKIVGGAVASSPIVGDIAGDSKPEIVALSMDKKLYAWHHDGQPVDGFPMTPVDHFGTEISFDFTHTPILVDYDPDDNGKMEIVFSHAWMINIVDGDGTQIATSNFPPGAAPFYYAEGLLINTPAVGDIDDDGKLELVANNSKLFVWNLPNGALTADWPMFKFNETRTSYPAGSSFVYVYLPSTLK